MTTIASDTQPYLDHFNSLARTLAGKGSSALLPLRREALSRFTELGFPTRRNEEWKYTDVSPLTRLSFRPAPADRPSGCLLNGALPMGGVTACRLVFVNGKFAPSLSVTEALPRGVKLLSLSAALATDFATVEAHLARSARFHEQSFVALNTALWEDGAFIFVPRGIIVEEPIHVLFLISPDAGPVMTHPRNLLIAEENSQATVIESYTGGEGDIYLTNAVTEIVLAENAVLDHYRVQRESGAAFHIATQQTHQSRGSNFSSHSIALGGSLVRNDVNAVLDGPGIESTLNGLYVASGRQHVDTHTAIDHAQPHCNSHELYKGILDGRATGVFNGKIFVRQDAQKTDAKQTNQNLLLSRDAEINTKPQLEIYADDVRCTHGATVGQLDDDAVFYLRSRGIGQAEARGLLTYAFASDILNRIRVAPLRELLETHLFARLPHAGVAPPGPLTETLE
jgi:Fe-S cluster assembly protein SufD